jgi:hypothetical protein
VKVYNLQEAQGKGKREATVVLVTGGRTGPTPIQNTAVRGSGPLREVYVVNNLNCVF